MLEPEQALAAGRAMADADAKRVEQVRKAKLQGLQLDMQAVAAAAVAASSSPRAVFDDEGFRMKPSPAASPRRPMPVESCQAVLAKLSTRKDAQQWFINAEAFARVRALRINFVPSFLASHVDSSAS